MSQRKPLQDQHIPSTREILESTGLFLKDTAKELQNPTNVKHTCPERKKLAQSNPSSIVVAANNAGAEIPLNKKSAKGFVRQAELEKKSMTTSELLEHAERERQIRDGFNERARKIQEETAQLQSKGLLTPEQIRRSRTEAAYNWSGGLIHTVLFAGKAALVPGNFAQKTYEMDKMREKRENSKVKGPGKSNSSTAS